MQSLPLSFRFVDGLSREFGAVFLPDCERSRSESLRPYEKVGHQQLQTCLFLSVSRCLHGFVRVMHTIWRETSDVAFALLLSACIIQISVPRSHVHQEAVVQPHSFVGAHTDGILVSQQSDSSMMQACTLGLFQVRSAAMSIALAIGLFLSSFSHGFT